jgi:5-amino-6-(5-phosphoribosylamino)uracil reductase
LSCAASIDGYIDDITDSRLLLSNQEDFDRVDAVRAGCDAIMVGANTIRKDNPRLLVRSQARQDARSERGATPSPAKVTITGSGNLDPAAKFFSAGDTSKIVYAASSALSKAQETVGGVATVADAGDPVDLRRVLEDLLMRGVGRLMVEGGGTVHTQFLVAGLVDELQLVVAPFFIGDARAPRFVYDGELPWNPGRHAQLAEVTKIKDVVLLRYAMSDRFDHGSHIPE